ncbi:MAG: hypothetical protein JXA96_16105 [Sedimentisphaerales bacterium]|nr:hypothetical protein [Sedimentisphaerales bacterium]
MLKEDDSGYTISFFFNFKGGERTKMKGLCFQSILSKILNWVLLLLTTFCTGNYLQASSNDYCSVAGNYCLQFDGSCYIDLHNSGYDFNGNGLTISLWTRIDLNYQNEVMGLAGKYGDSGFCLYFDNGQFVFMVGRQSQSTLIKSPQTSYADGKWHHVAGTFIENVGVLYVDGNRVKSDNEIKFQDSSQAAYIGKKSSSNNDSLLIGMIDNVQFYKQALAQEQIQDVLKGNTLDNINPASYWPFEEGVGTGTADISGNNHNGTFVSVGVGDNMPIWIDTEQLCHEKPDNPDDPPVNSIVKVDPNYDGNDPNIVDTIQNAIGKGRTIELCNGVHKANDIEFTALDYPLILRSESEHSERCIIDCNDFGRAFDISDCNYITIEGVTFIRGKADEGGAVRICNTPVSISNCIFTDNSAVSSNDEIGGGAISIEKTDSNTYDAIIEDCRFFANNAVSDGGAIVCIGQNLSISNSSFYENSATEGGAIAVYDLPSELKLNNNTFNYNEVSSSGGAIYSKGCAVMNAVNNVFALNQANYGGGCFISDCNDPDTAFVNCTFSNNSSLKNGGALDIYNSNLKLINSILWANQIYGLSPEQEGSQLYIENSEVSVSYCNIQGCGGDFEYQDSGYGTDIGGNLDTDPLFVFDDNPLLMWNSPCIDNGTDTLFAMSTTDRDGRERVLDGDDTIGSQVDMGAFEYDQGNPAIGMSPRVFHVNGNPEVAFVEAQLLEFKGSGPETVIPDYMTLPVFHGFTPFYDSEAPDGTEQWQWLKSYRGPEDNLKSYTLQLDPNGTVGPHLGMLSITEPNGIAIQYSDKENPTNFDALTREVFISALIGRTLFVDNNYDLNEITLDPATHFNTIQAAIDNAIDGDIIKVANGEYLGAGNTSIDLKGKVIYIKSASGDPTSCIINCGNKDYGFLCTKSEQSDTLIEGIGIKNAKEVGIQCSPGSPTIRNCRIEDCNVGVSLSTSKSHIYQCEFYGTISHSITVTGSKSSPRILGCKFVDAKSGFKGAAVYLSENIDALITGCTFEDCNASDTGGAIYDNGSQQTTIRDCQFKDCRSNKNGGDIYLNTPVDAQVVNCTFTSSDTNKKTNNGGAIFIQDGSAEINSNTFSNKNVSYAGAAIYLSGDNSTKIVNSVFHHNSATSFGGGVFTDTASEVSIYNCTFYDNKATKDSNDIYSQGELELRNSILWSEKPGDRLHVDPSKSVIEFCTIRDQNDLTEISASKPNWGQWFRKTFEGNINQDPKFVNATNTNQIDLRLRAGSPCIDTGCDIDGIYADRRGSLRPIDGDDQPKKVVNNDMDMGSYEYSGYYGGSRDSTVKALADVHIPAFARVGNECQLHWTHNQPAFPHDLRVEQAPTYEVDIFLQSMNGLEKVFLTTLEISSSVPPSGVYDPNIVFKPSHVGQWKLLVALHEDNSQFEISSGSCYIASREPEIFTVGTEVVLKNWDQLSQLNRTIKPEIQDSFENAFFWSDYAKRLYIKARVAGALITWKDRYGDSIHQLVTADYPEDGNGSGKAQVYLTESPDVELLPEGKNKFQYVEVVHTESHVKGNITGGSKFTTEDNDGYSVLLFGTDSHYNFVPTFKVVHTVKWVEKEEPGEAIIGAELIYIDPNEKGWIYNEVSPYDTQIYDRDTLSGQIVPVNTNLAGHQKELIVFWYKTDQSTQIQWPTKPVRYNISWPTLSTNPKLEKIVIASEKGSEVYGQNAFNNNYLNVQIYNQPDPVLPGYNPNEEHALFKGSKTVSGGQTIYALRNDLNRTDPNGFVTSAPYVLVKYQQPNTGKWTYRVFKVDVEDANFPLQDTSTAGTQIQPPYPLSEIKTQTCMDKSFGDPDATSWWKDRNKVIWARHATEESKGVNIYWYYPLLDGFWYDLNADGYQDVTINTPLPWLSHVSGNADVNIPLPVAYNINWPHEVAELSVGETVMKAKAKENGPGLPDITGAGSVEIIYDESWAKNQKRSVQLIDPMREYSVELKRNDFPSEINVRNSKGRDVFVDIPYHLRMRLTYDSLKEQLCFAGYFNDRVDGEPLLLPNIMTDREKQRIQELGFASKVEELYNESHQQINQYDPNILTSQYKAVTAGYAQGTGYVTVALNSDKSCKGNPVELRILKVVCPPYRGEVKIILPDNPFDEKVTFRHGGDFAGRSGDLEFMWKYSMEKDEPSVVGLLTAPTWYDYPTIPHDGIGSVDITLEGSGIQVLQDKWVTCRYRYLDSDSPCNNIWSEWTEPRHYDNWVKRVRDEINEYDQRYDDFYDVMPNTTVDMIAQVGGPYVSEVSLTYDSDNLNNMGLLSFYQSILERAKMLSIDDGIKNDLANEAILMAAGRVADMYTLLGNESYADAQDPTIGFKADSADIISMGPSVFCFQNQLPTLLDEELALLRGVPQDEGFPVYNRLTWNFVNGLADPVYALNYNISDRDDSGSINELDAKNKYPQGHGDAWGHYLSGIKIYYDLLNNPNYKWQTRSETMTLTGIDRDIEVDYWDERRFAGIAAAKAQTGLAIVDKTFRQAYCDDPVEQLLGYPDNNEDRAWGVTDWAQRTGQGAYLDWVAGNAILPATSDKEGIQKIDRTTVLELDEIAAIFTDIQAKLDQADAGLNPMGLSQDTIPFDINPSELVDKQGNPTGRTHFEQIYDRAMQALNLTATVFNQLKTYSQALYAQQDSLESFKTNVADREADFNSRLIEIFGTPYEEDMGVGGLYKQDYDGPDLYHFDYVDSTDLMGLSIDDLDEVRYKFKDFDVDDDGVLVPYVLDVNFVMSTDGYGIIKPREWTSKRSSPGEIQFSRSDLLQSLMRFEKGMVDYDNMLNQIEDQSELLQAQYNLNDQEIAILNRVQNTQISLNDAIKGSRKKQLQFRTVARQNIIVADALTEYFPKIVGIASDTTSVARGVIKFAAALINESLTIAADKESLSELDFQQAKELESSESNIELTGLRSAQAAEQQLKQLEQLIRSEASMRLELYNLYKAMDQAADRYRSALARGQRLLEDQLRFRKQTAANVQNYRYKDMAFRVFRDEAVQKYTAQFDLAARYVYLAAQAYDYETALPETDPRSGRQIAQEICRQRTLGDISQNIPLPGQGLAGVMSKLRRYFFDEFQGLMRFDNPQVETTSFSVRWECFRIPLGSQDPNWLDPNEHLKYQFSSLEPDMCWQELLKHCRVENLWDECPEFARYCKPFDEVRDEPALVIPFETKVASRLNFFGKNLEGNDSHYSPTNFATKVYSVGIWLSNYDTSMITRTPYVYLIPIGSDSLRVPWGDMSDSGIRTWHVQEQGIPQLLSLVDVDPTQPGWIPLVDSLQTSYAGVRRYSEFRAYPDGSFAPTDMTYDSRLVGRSVWNNEWLLIIPGASLHNDPKEGIERFIYGAPINGDPDNRTGYGITDIKLFFKTYSYMGY